MSRFCLDTSACSRFQRGLPDIVTLLDEAEWIGLPTITLGELRTGYLLGSRQGENDAWLIEFLGHPVVEELGVDGSVARIYAEIMVDLRRSGTPIPTTDVWNAATAARHGATVLTTDRHFHHVARVGAQILPT
jgi:tRNA(fMet)-specific endonuclease VapC